ncbi:MAG: PAS domain S-box protein [Bacteroidota bacterium]
MAPPPAIPPRFLEIIPDMCFVVSGERMILDCNAQAREMFDLPARLNGTIPFYSLLTEDSPRPLLTVLRTGKPVAEGEVRLRAADGRVVDALLFIRTLRQNGAPILYVVARDVSEAKKKELDLLRFSNVVHYTVNPIQITDSLGRMVYVNPAFERATGYSKEELIGRTPGVISSGKYSREFWQKVWAAISSGSVWTGEIENRKKGGEALYTQLLISPIIDAEGKVTGYLGAHRDITKQKELEQQLMHSQKMESIGTLAAGIAHEVGNPLASISSVVQVLARTTNDPFAREKLALVQSQVHRITKIIRDLVDFSRPSNYQIQPTDLARSVKDAVEIVRMSKKAKEIAFQTEVRADIPLLSLVPDQVSQVFINILLNAVDAMNGTPGVVSVTVDRSDQEVSVTIRDTGLGIAPANMPKIFEPFFTTKPVGEGTGLGLWVSYGIIRSFRGDIAVRSEPGRGAVFTVTLPLHTGGFAHG